MAKERGDTQIVSENRVPGIVSRTIGITFEEKPDSILMTRTISKAPLHLFRQPDPSSRRLSIKEDPIRKDTTVQQAQWRFRRQVGLSVGATVFLAGVAVVGGLDLGGMMHFANISDIIKAVPVEAGLDIAALVGGTAGAATIASVDTASLQEAGQVLEAFKQHRKVHPLPQLA